MLEGVFGDGWDGQCPCRLCKREWLNAGWVCPAVYYRREYVNILDARHRAQTGDLHTRRSEAEDWDALVLAIHFENSPPPDSELVDAPHSRSHSRSRSR